MIGKEKVLCFYIVFMFLTDVVMIGGCAYLVGWHGWSGWWFVLAVASSFPSRSVLKYTTGIDIYK